MSDPFPAGTLEINSGHSLASQCKYLWIPRSATTCLEVVHARTLTYNGTGTPTYDSDGWWYGSSSNTAGFLHTSPEWAHNVTTSFSIVGDLYRPSTGTNASGPERMFYQTGSSNIRTSIESDEFNTNLRWWVYWRDDGFSPWSGASASSTSATKRAWHLYNTAANARGFEYRSWAAPDTFPRGSGTTTGVGTNSTNYNASNLSSTIYVGCAQQSRWRYVAVFSNALSQAEFESFADDPGALVQAAASQAKRTMVNRWMNERNDV